MSLRTDGRTQLTALSQALGLKGSEELGDPALGTLVRRARSSWVTRLNHLGEEVYIKTYDYPRLSDRLRGALRNTGPFTPSRAAREAAAANWLAEHGFQGARVVGLAEFRTLGFVRRAILATAAVAGKPLNHALRDAIPPARAAIGAALGDFVARLHRLGFRDRNLDLRNLLLVEDGETLRLCKIDSPRFRLVRPGPPVDALAQADWARLLPQLEPYGLVEVTLHAAAAAGGLGTTEPGTT